MIPDDQEGRLYDSVGPPVFNQSGLRMEYAAKEDNQWFIVSNGIESKHYDMIRGGYPVFSPDGLKELFIAKEHEKEFLVIDGIEGKPYDYIGQVIVSPDGQRIDYKAMNHDKWFIVLDQAENKKHKALARNYFNFTPDSKHFCYMARVNWWKWSLIVDGKAGKQFGFLLSNDMSFDSSGKMHFFVGDLIMNRYISYINSFQIEESFTN
jgi:hypothetical protein